MVQNRWKKKKRKDLAEKKCRCSIDSEADLNQKILVPLWSCLNVLVLVGAALTATQPRTF